jgi:predicted transposase YdaD
MNRAREVGERNKALEVTRNLKANGIPVEQIFQATGLSLEGIEQM